MFLSTKVNSEYDLFVFFPRELLWITQFRILLRYPLLKKIRNLEIVYIFKNLLDRLLILIEFECIFGDCND